MPAWLERVLVLSFAEVSGKAPIGGRPGPFGVGTAGHIGLVPPLAGQLHESATVLGGRPPLTERRVDGLARRQMDGQTDQGAVITHPDGARAEFLPVIADVRDVLQSNRDRCEPSLVICTSIQLTSRRTPMSR